MAVLITYHPSGGPFINDGGEHAVEALRLAYHDDPHVSVLTDEEFAALPTCSTCGEWVRLRRCADCR